MKILVVEDQLSIQEEMKFLLEEFGTVDTADNGRIGVEMFCIALVQKEPYDLVFMDIQMPEMDGQEALKMIRQVERDNLDVDLSGMKKMSLVFMLTMLNNEANVVEAFFYGACTDYLVKPITRKALLAKMKQHKLIEYDGAEVHSWGAWKK
ncbi:MAG: response regulator [Magnetococcales bacterium]|nr:response regulator [Magnetococcales bacterium]